jgi:hypothetical protein
MRPMLAFLAGLMLCCAEKTVVVEPPIPEDHSDMNGVMALLSMESIGHACPVDGVVYTAKHNVYDVEARKPTMRGFSWEDGYGNKGVVHTGDTNDYYDLAKLAVPTGTPVYYERGEDPEIGDEVRWVEFSQEKEEVCQPEVKTGRVMSSLAGYIFIDTPPIPGASGGCLIDSEGKAVGMIVWGIRGLAGVAVELP